MTTWGHNAHQSWLCRHGQKHCRYKRPHPQKAISNSVRKCVIHFNLCQYSFLLIFFPCLVFAFCQDLNLSVAIHLVKRNIMFLSSGINHHNHNFDYQVKWQCRRYIYILEVVTLIWVMVISDLLIMIICSFKLRWKEKKSGLNWIWGCGQALWDCEIGFRGNTQ